MSSPKRIFEMTVIDDGDTVRLIAKQEDRIGNTYVTVYGQSRDALSLPYEDDGQWRRDMAVLFLEGL